MFNLIELSVVLSPEATLEFHIPVGAALYAIFSWARRR